MAASLFEAFNWPVLIAGLGVAIFIIFILRWLVRRARINSTAADPVQPAGRANQALRPRSLTSGSAWPMFQGNLLRTGVTAEVLEPPLRKIWEFKPAGYIHSSPAISEGRLFVGTADRGTNQGNFYALEAGSGQVIWMFKTDGAIYSSPSVHQGRVYFGSNDRNFYALEAKSGKLVWKYQNMPPEPDNPFSGLFFSSPIVMNNLVCMTEDLFYLLETQTGREVARLEVGEWTGSNPAFQAGILYAGLYRNVVALDLQKAGRSLWSSMPGGRISSGPVIANGLVYVGTSRQVLHALDAKTGQAVWEFEIEGEPLNKLPGIQSSPAVSQGKIFFGAPDAKVYALDAKTGKKIWSFDTSAYISSSPIVSGAVVYLVSETGALLALDVNHGTLLWQFDCQSNDCGSPVICNGRLYLGSDRLYAFSQ